MSSDSNFLDKLCNYCQQIGLLNQEHFNILASCAKLDIVTKPSIVIMVNINNVIPIETFKYLWINTNKLSNLIKVEFKGSLNNVTIDELTQYIQYFLDINHIRNMGIVNLVKRQSFSLDVTGELTVQYFNKIELDEFKIHETELITFLSSIGFNIKIAKYKMDENRQNFVIYQQKQIDDMKKQHVTFKNDDPYIRKIAVNNEIKVKADTQIKDLEVGLKGVIIHAQIFDIKPVVTTKTNKKIYKFSVTDFTGGITLTIFEALPSRDAPKWMQRDLPASYLDTFRVGDWIKVKVNINTDKYSVNELSGMVDKIVKTAVPDKYTRKDIAAKPRIELLARTKMSAFDGISSVNDLLQRSKDFNAPAIAIADRCNVQVYPDLFNGSNKLKQKPIYGVELDVQDNVILLAQNATDQKILDSDYIVFDIETTGLYNEFEELIEFAGVKIHNNVVVDQLQFFVKPEKEIPAKITKLTHITNEMVKNADGVKPALKKIVEWIGNDVLIAHNGINFDFRFLNKKLEQNNMTLLKNTMVDTMQISRAINTGLKHHNLGIIARSYRINYDETIAHRADVDVSVLHGVWKNLTQSFKQYEIQTFNDLNSKLQNESLRSHQFGKYQLAYCKTQNGIKDLYRLVSISCTTDFYNSPKVIAKNLYDKRENLLIVNSPTDGDVWDVAINGTLDELKTTVQKYDYVFVTPPATFEHEINRGSFTKANVHKIIKKIIDVAIELNKKVIAVSNSYYLDTWDQIAHSVFVHNKMIGGKQHRLFRYDEDNSVLPDLHYRNTEEMLEEFKFIADSKLLNEIVIENTYDFNEQIQNDIKPLNNKLAMPHIPGAPDKLRELVESKAKSLFGEGIKPLIRNRIDKELNSIIDNGYAIVYWISHLLVKKSLEDGYLVGSRGSVGSSIVAFLANISEVNPLPAHYLCSHCKHIDFDVNHENGFDLPKKACPVCGTIMKGDGHNIPFETFLGFHAEKVPDIDLNFSGVYQLKAHQFVKDMFGETHTIRAGTISTMAQQTARGYVKKYFELTQPDRQVSWTEIDWIANKCIDSKRTTGQHAGGIVIVPKEKDILDFTPYNYPADDKKSGGYTTHFDFHSLHDSLLKFDILGHDDPTALKMLEEITGVKPREIPFMDENVIKLFSSIESLKIASEDILGETVGAIGLPEFGTGFVRRMLATAQPKSFADLIRIQGLSHGTDVWNNNAEQLISKANKTLKEVIACRDDIMTYLIKKGVKPEVAFKAMEDARKGKGVKQYREELKSVGVEDWYIDACDKIKYLFPKAHAAAYAVSGWRFAWFKYHFPLAFYATYFSIRPDSFDLPTIMSGAPAIREKLFDIRKRAHLRDNVPDALSTKEKDRIPAYEVALEMYARGFNIQNISLEKSEATKFIINDKGLIPPFSVIEGMGEIMAQSIVEARAITPFTSKEDLKNRTRVSVGHLETMNKMGITNKLEDDNQMHMDSFFD